jgi:hypothetical protein
MIQRQAQPQPAETGQVAMLIDTILQAHLRNGASLRITNHTSSYYKPFACTLAFSS